VIHGRVKGTTPSECLKNQVALNSIGNRSSTRTAAISPSFTCGKGIPTQKRVFEWNAWLCKPPFTIVSGAGYQFTQAVFV
jgi:hypothetical protein